MKLSLNIFCLILGCLTFCSFQCSSASSSSGSSGKLEDEHCGKNKFYCQHNDQCFDRKLRCTSAMVCADSNGYEAKCYESGSDGMHKYFKKKSPLPVKLIGNVLPKHWFVEYRGFVYEFGVAGYQELDINDPNYKYGPGREKVSSNELMGTSSCTRDEVTTFINRWLADNPDYKLLANNCQDFAKALLNELGKNCPHRVKRQADGSLKAECSVNSAAVPRIFSLNWKLHALSCSLIAFVVFNMN